MKLIRNLLLIIPLLVSGFEYSPDDNILLLNGTSFQSFLNSSNKPILVEFFRPSCGHCRNFAPKFIGFAKSVQNWNDMITIGAMSCDFENFCKEMKITGVPTILIFLPWIPNWNYEIKLSDGKGLVQELISSLKEIQNNLPPPPSSTLFWPSLHSSSLQSAYENCDNKFCYFLVKKNQTDFLPEIIAMDLYRLKNKINIFFSDSSDFLKDNLYKLQQNNFVTLQCTYSREGLLGEILKDSGSNLNFSLDFDSFYPKENEKIIDENYIYRPAHKFYLKDLYSNLRFTLYNEVPSLQIITVEAKNDLIEYLKIILQYLPIKREAWILVEEMVEWLESMEGEVPSQSWDEKLKQCDQAFLPKQLEWKGCLGTTEDFRGFPCSLWMTFHTLTVFAHLKRKQNYPGEGYRVLLGIRNYIKHFFTCSFCQKNFLKETDSWLERENDFFNSTSNAILELWIKHNKVNKRLHITSPFTEDPLHPKIQFPAKEDCPLCRKQTFKNLSVFDFDLLQWNLDEVLKFLIEYYGHPLMESCQDIGRKEVKTSWTPCSKTCGFGISSRLSNKNEFCLLRKDVKFCALKPCPPPKIDFYSDF